MFFHYLFMFVLPLSLHAVRLALQLKLTGCIPLRLYTSRLTKGVVFATLEWIKNNCAQGWKPGVIKKHVVAGQSYAFNVMYRNGSGNEAWKQYQRASKTEKHVGDAYQLGRGSFLTLLGMVTERVRSKACLSYFYTRLVETYDTFDDLICEMERVHLDAVKLLYDLHLSEERYAAVVANLGDTILYTTKRKEIASILVFAKYQLKGHLRVNHKECGGVGLHCIPHGLRCGSAKTTTHTVDCPDCLKFVRCGSNVRFFLQDRSNVLCRQLENLLGEFQCRQSSITPYICATSLRASVPVTSATINDETPNVQGLPPITHTVQCADCGEKFHVPPELPLADLPQEWMCCVRTWRTHPRAWDSKTDAQWCNNQQTNYRAIKRNAADLATKKKALAATVEQNTQAVEEVSHSVVMVNLGSPSIEEVIRGVVMDAVPPTVQPLLSLTNGDLSTGKEGRMKTFMKALVTTAQSFEYAPKHYHAHVGRELWQDHQIKMHKAFLRRADNAGKIAMFTIDMKGKTPTAKNREEQGYQMGAVGMSLQGGMLHFFQDGVEQQHFIDLIYNQRSNQTLPEAMTALSAQLDFIRKTYPTLHTIFLTSDKCNNFNSFDQVNFHIYN